MSETPTNDKAIIFLHIPKTAGTTLTHVIRRHFKPDVCYTGALSSTQGLETFKLPVMAPAAWPDASRGKPEQPGLVAGNRPEI